MSKVWLITGSARGLGWEVANAALAAGHRVVATARKPEQLRALVEAHPERARAVALDVADPAAARAAVESAVGAFGRLDVVVNNAGYANVSSIEDVTDEDFRTQFETNFFGVVNVTRAALPVLRKQRDGHIVQISSIGGRRGSPGLGSYQSAKWAVEGFSEVLFTEVQPLGIRVTIVEPGGFRTDWGGSSMRIDPIQPDYEATVGAVRARLRKSQDGMRGDPVKGAQVIVKVAGMPEPPLRLLLGTDAMFLAKVTATRRAAEDEKWAALSASTDFDGLGDFADTEVAKMFLPVRR
ncbi:oxidoreductase [Polyangium aurulentum]|uniref:oxidoreductase n=1 Tax=Polyangium aurulentum TaxID=2567896 RepID=UPI0010AEAB5B|nr:oxidoreductase [Polyangium aurulentum]UQA59372.1 SDR family NAD(P)-dependent oxidoreductase [Polyangium aurulentum]